ncbi:hypothetical protein AVEN_130709-1 [Araneus ventricosus]|uniref:Uncharacterized protein n=1 Tax=Araneus ventricosus TaxID=182803 RepID=A0A4Y2F8L2_ARAVE|nr:hypothetical protein AVEN_130709-1 [Araneus ventricosus]
MMMIGSSVDYVRSGGMRKVPVTKAVEHLYVTAAKFSKRVRNLGLTSCVLLPATSDSSLSPKVFSVRLLIEPEGVQCQTHHLARRCPMSDSSLSPKMFSVVNLGLNRLKSVHKIGNSLNRKLCYE